MIQTLNVASIFYNSYFSDNSSFSMERISQMRKLTGSCKVDIGACPVGSCSARSFFIPFFKCPDNGYICPETENRTADCGSAGQREYQFVTRCKCCKDVGITVTGTVVDAVTKQPLTNIKIKVARRIKSYTDADGVFNATIDSDMKSLILRAMDQRMMYMDAVKVVDIPDGFRGPVNATLFMFQKAAPITVDSTVQSILSLSNDPKDPSIGNANIVIEPNSFTDENGNQYDGPVDVSVTFIDSNEVPEAVIPGRFLTPVGDSLENLISDGIVSFDFKSVGGDDLKVKRLKFNLREGMRIWDLNTKTGLWEPAKVLPARRKRQVTLTEEFLISVSSGRWYNIDKIPNAPKCYFKARIFNVTSGSEITSSVLASFKPEIIAYTFQKQRLRLYSGFTKSPSETCFEVRCPVVTNPDQALAGFINMTSTETVSIGGTYLPSLSNLRPKPIDQYDAIIRSELESVEYSIAPNGLDVFVNFVSGVNGPFFDNKKACERADINEAALHFFKPELPSYEPSSNDTELCTARIAFRDNWNFNNYTAGLKTLPTITSISVWEEEGQSLFYNHTTSLEVSNVAGQEFVFACVEYRCSPSDTNSSSTPTTVYLDINIPNITYTYNYTHLNGSLVSENYTMPAFYCFGKCNGPLCKSQGRSVNGTSIDGSFNTKYITSPGADFYNSTQNTCKDRLVSEPFAYEFRCHSNDEMLEERSGEGREIPM